jgi:hypothetical protein
VASSWIKSSNHAGIELSRWLDDKIYITPSWLYEVVVILNLVWSKLYIECHQSKGGEIVVIDMSQGLWSQIMYNLNWCHHCVLQNTTLYNSSFDWTIIASYECFNCIAPALVLFESNLLCWNASHIFLQRYDCSYTFWYIFCLFWVLRRLGLRALKI